MSVYTITYDLPTPWAKAYAIPIKRIVADVIATRDNNRYWQVPLLHAEGHSYAPSPDLSIEIMVVTLRVARKGWDIMVSAADAHSKRIIAEDAKTCIQRAAERDAWAKAMLEIIDDPVLHGEAPSE